MQNIQRHRRELSASLDIFRCLEEHYQKLYMSLCSIGQPQRKYFTTV